MTRRDWRDQALCRHHDPDEFVPDVCLPAVVEELREVCSHCPVAATCLETALAEEYGLPAQLRSGVRAGTTPRERHAMYRRSRKPAAA
ncbi:WhiB family transcriptional regulator [Streptomyces kronopolitis]|uniref:WhiB family transcriptional regulator n=1 Tax=Streptomyces kronopolitis TaxID=1612435 RepID=UPI0034387C48